jgi:hypothetical protein
LREQFGQVGSNLCKFDLIAWAVILGFGLFQFLVVDPAKLFLNEDVFYADSARAMIQQGFYGINGYAETNMPPGVSALIGFLSLLTGYDHAAYLRSMVILGTLGFLASYELLRRQAPRGVAAAICFLLISSNTYFEGVTHSVTSCYPYFLAATCALLVARRLEIANGSPARMRFAVALAALISTAIMFASAGIAFLGGILVRILGSFLRNRTVAVHQLKMYAFVLLIGIAVQGFWTHRGRAQASAGIAASEWPLPGFPRSYLSNLIVKHGNEPEAGLAKPGDVIVRVAKNSYLYSNLFCRMLFDRWDRFPLVSFMALATLLLVLAGWIHSIWLDAAGLQNWYFCGYVCIYVLWPWSLEPRFFLPIAALAGLYLWRGLGPLAFLIHQKPRLLATGIFLCSAVLTATALLWLHGSTVLGRPPHNKVHEECSIAVGLASMAFAVWAICRNSFRRLSVPQIPAFNSFFGSFSAQLAETLAVVLVMGLALKGLATQVELGRTNLDPSSIAREIPTEARAGAWLRANTGINAIIMARHVPLASHYTARRIVWFPPSSDPELLLRGIASNNVNFVLVVRRKSSYYLPAEEVCFQRLLRAHPSGFRLAGTAEDFQVFEVVPKAKERTSVEQKGGSLLDEHLTLPITPREATEYCETDSMRPIAR